MSDIKFYLCKECKAEKTAPSNKIGNCRICKSMVTGNYMLCSFCSVHHKTCALCKVKSRRYFHTSDIAYMV